MKKILKNVAGYVFLVCAGAVSCLGADVVINLGGNAYVTAGNPAVDAPNFDGRVRGIELDEDGLRGWKNPDAVVSVFFSIERAQKEVELSLNARGFAVYEISVCGKTFRVPVASEDFGKVYVGKVSLPVAGYNRIDIRGVEKSGETFGEISEVCLDGVEGTVNYVHDFSNYWGRRGPSVHLVYNPPRHENIEYFYNEVFVPKGSDVPGSYFMACGFGQGYFGIQSVSSRKRLVLFSVWSPAKEDVLGRVSAEEQVRLRKKGRGVIVRTFEHEGTGGQSILLYPWRTETNYKFLVRVRPAEGNMTEYTGYFFAPEENAWRLIASFYRPKTQTWLVSPHSFLENFSDDLGWKSREVFFGSSWVRDSGGRWHEMTTGRFDFDSTGKRRVRVDYFGGVSENGTKFHLKNCGFFNADIVPGARLVRCGDEAEPAVDFEEIESLSV